MADFINSPVWGRMPDSLPVPASDFGPLVTDVLLFLGVLVGGALLLGITTSAVLVRLSRQKWQWAMAPIYGIVWFAMIFGAWQFWTDHLSPGANYYREGGQGTEPAPINVTEPESDLLPGEGSPDYSELEPPQ